MFKGCITTARKPLQTSSLYPFSPQSCPAGADGATCSRKGACHVADGLCYCFDGSHGPACEQSAGPAAAMPVAGPLFGATAQRRRLLTDAADAEVVALGVAAGRVEADRALAGLAMSVPTALLAALTLVAMLGVAGAAIVLLLRPATHGYLPL